MIDPANGGRKAGFRLGALLTALLLTGCTLRPMPPTQPPCAQVPVGLISWWQGEGNASDALGVNAATLENGVSFDAGMVGQAFRFDGVDDTVTAAGTGIDDLQQLTIEGWAKLNSLPADSAARFVTLGDEKAVLGYDGLTLGRQFLHFILKVDGELRDILVDGVLKSGVFHHVAGTYDGSVMRLYLDGAPVGSQTVSGTLDPGGGIELGSPVESMDGLLDEIAIYDRALTSSEIQAIYAAGPAGKCPVDDDNDGVSNITDNCPYHANVDQADADHDGRGDVCEIKHVVVLDIDGLRADVLSSYLASPDSEGGVLREITLRKIEAPTTTTILPSLTFAGHASLFTGVYPAKHGITGNEWLDRTVADQEDRSRSYTATSVAAYGDVMRVYGYGVKEGTRIALSDAAHSDGLANRDLQAKTLYEYACEAGRRSVVSFNMFWKGLARDGDATVPCGNYLVPQPQDLWEWMIGNSHQYESSGSVRRLLDYLDTHDVPDIVTLYLPGLDHESHVHGVSEQAKYLQWYDKGAERPLGRVVDKLKDKGAYDNTVFIIVADHGQSEVNGDDAHSILLEERHDKEIEEVIEDEYGDIYDFYDEDEYDSFAGFNSGVLQIYLRNRGQVPGESADWQEGSLPIYPNFLTDVLPVVRAINDHRCGTILGGVAEPGELCETGEDAVEEVLVKDRSHGYQVIRPVGDTPAGQGCEEQFDPRTDASTGFVLCPLSMLESLHPEYVDPVRRIAGLSHIRSGDILLLPACLKGYHFTGSDEKADHGGLYPGDSYIPFIIAGKPLDRSITVTGLRSIVDVAPTIADLLGFYRGIEDRFDGQSILEPGFIAALGEP
jgi:arylsulfatase A-like enzyme